MPKLFNPPLKLIFFFAFLSLFVGCQSNSEKQPPLKINLKEQPTIGDLHAPVHIVVFEEPKCSMCKKFTTLIYPLIKKNYIDTNLVRFTIIPVSFIPQSMQAAVAWLCIYHQKSSSPQVTFKYIDYLYSNQPAEESDSVTVDNLIKYAKEVSPEINLDLLKDCLLKDKYQVQIEKNTRDGTKLMKGELATPAIYINGKAVETMTYEAIRQMIDQNLMKK